MDNKVKTKVKKKKYELTPIKITIVSLGAFILMLSIGISPGLMGNSVSKESYKIIYNSNGGIGKMENQIVKYNKSVHLNRNEFKKEGYYFNGWIAKRSNNTWWCYKNNSTIDWTSQNDCNKYGYMIFNDGDSINNIVNPGESVYMYATWIK